MLNTQPLPGFVQIKMESVKIGAMDASMRKSAVECAEVVAVGVCACVAICGNIADICSHDCHRQEASLKAGDKVFVKAWAIDTITYEGEEYQYVNLETNGILAKIHG